MPRRTIGDLLERWPYQPEGLCLRVITGDDGTEQLQIRLDLGVLQLALEGRPDGRRPHGFAGLLEYHLAQREQYRRRHHTIEGFQLTPADCENLRSEAAQVYQRYFSCFHLGRYQTVERDTARNLTVLDLCWRHSSTEADRWELEQYRPYITMMNALARCELHVADYDHDAAARALQVAIASIRAFGAQHGDRFPIAREVETLAERARAVEQERPRSEADHLQRQLADAIAHEDYEAAARLRDRLERCGADELPPFWE
ncbi:MAG: UvrB/UvrC motif-containing protein [Fimbriimonadaceae bacterium]|nr:UvrB/UvrC motif-containing protein [Fimbriimonadaceae bacterium]